MQREVWKPGNMLYPLPAVLVSCGDLQKGYNVLTIAWTGTVCSDPPMVYISVRPSRHSYSLIKESGEFVINLTTSSLVKATDYCGVVSGRDVDKFAKMGLHPLAAHMVRAPLIEESPVNIECKVKQILPLGTHHMFLADVCCVDVDSQYMDENGKFSLQKAGLITYSHGEYFSLGKNLGKFGYSVRKKRKGGSRHENHIH